jgi:FkbM family methyltransferase
MLINLSEAIKRHGLKIKGAIHVGGHIGQELTDYLSNGIKDIVFIEPCAETFEKLKENVEGRAILFNCACGESEDIMEINKEKANGGQSNSLLKPALHTKHYPDIVFNDTEVVEVKPLDSLDIDRSRYNMLNMDTQGYELNVLKGAKETLKGIDYIFSEVNEQELYQGCVQLKDLCAYLSDFDMVEIKRTKQGWGDALFIRKQKKVKMPQIFQQRETKPYPSDNTPSFEEYFLDNYKDNLSDRVYLPILWTGYYKLNKYGQYIPGMRNLQNFLDGLDRSKKYFSVIQYDDGCLSNIKGLDIKFYSMGCKGDYQLPLICQPHGRVTVEKNIFASFIGRETHPIRKKVLELKGKDGYLISTEPTGIDAYRHILASSLFTLCPRGYGKTSFRIAEALEQGSIPVYISDEHLEPHGVRFSSYGITLSEADDIDTTLKGISENRISLLQMAGKRAYENYYIFESNYQLIIKDLNKTV